MTPAKATAVAIRQLGNNDYECLSAFGFDSLFNLKLSHNTKRTKAILEHRVKSKQWLAHWPQLVIVS